MYFLSRFAQYSVILLKRTRQTIDVLTRLVLRLCWFEMQVASVCRRHICANHQR